MAGRGARRLLGGALALLALAGAATLVATRRAARPPAPEVALTTLDGAPLRLEALRGKVVLLDFWATWCGPCRDEAPALVALERAYRPRGVEVVGISMDDDAAPVRAFVREHRVGYAVALGDVALAERFGRVLGLPVKFLIDRQGRIAARHDGPVDAGVLGRELDALLAE